VCISDGFLVEVVVLLDMEVCGRAEFAQRSLRGVLPDQIPRAWLSMP
jgi:hypothetical protein